MSRSLGLRCEKCLMANSNLSLQWTVPGLLGERGQAAAPAVVWVQGNLTVMSRDNAGLLGRACQVPADKQ